MTGLLSDKELKKLDDELDEFVNQQKNKSTFNQTQAVFKPKTLTTGEKSNPLEYYANNNNFMFLFISD